MGAFALQYAGLKSSFHNVNFRLLASGASEILALQLLLCAALWDSPLKKGPPFYVNALTNSIGTELFLWVFSFARTV